MKKKGMTALILTLCLAAPVFSAGESVYASQFSDEAKKDEWKNIELAECMMKISYEYESYKSKAEFAKAVGREIYGKEDYCTAEDIQKAIDYFAKNSGMLPAKEDGSALSKQETANLMMEYWGLPEKFVKDFYLNVKEKASSNVKDMTITVADAVYKGKAVKPKVTVVNAGKTLKKGTDYTVTYKNNKKPGTGTAVIKGKGKYKGTAKVSFTIKSNDIDESLPTFSFRQAEIVGDDVFLIWSNSGGKDDSIKVEILRATAGSNDFKVVGTVGKTPLGFVQHSYIDEGAGSGSYQYKLRAVKGKKYGKESSAKKAEPSKYKWYKCDDGEYICMRPWADGTADFTGFDANFDVVWNCDWNYSHNSEKDSYHVSMYWDPGDGSGVYDQAFDYTITDEIFRDEGNGHTSYAINDVPISIE